MSYDSYKKWKEKHPEKDKAHKAVFVAIRNGTLKRGKCRDCCSLKTEAHHEDYSNPLLVIWLCKKHHTFAHIKDYNKRKLEFRGISVAMIKRLKKACI